MIRLRLLFFLLLAAGQSFAAGISDTAIIRAHMVALTETPTARHAMNIPQLDRTADFIKEVFSKYSDDVTVQEFTADGRTYKNIICSFGIEHNERIIIGAHYDVCGNQPGADDNASGVTGILELARLLKEKKLNHRVDLVAYTLEEPPYFNSEHMGSYVHAKSLYDDNVDVCGMISVEMIGYFDNAKGSQTYPFGIMSLLYGKRANYISLIKNFGAGKFARQFSRRYKRAHTIRTVKLSAPGSLPGISFSDHANYWRFGFSALMITDTAVFRNYNYHQPSDTIATLDLFRMSKVIDGIYLALMAM